LGNGPGLSVGARTPWHTATRLRDTVRAGGHEPALVLRYAEAELAIGHASHARELLARYPIADSNLDVPTRELRAAIAYELGEFPVAADQFVLLADAASGRDRGVYAARAAGAFERAGRKAEARAFYLLASSQLPQVAHWLSWRRSRVAADPATALLLLDSVPLAGASLVAAWKPEVLLRLGDVAGAIAGFTAAGRWCRAGEVALAARDTAAGRRFFYQALTVSDTMEVVRALHEVLVALPPRGPAELLAVARAARNRDARQAETFARRAVRGGDSSAAALLVWGGALLDLRDTATALRVLARGASAAGADAAPAAYLRARLLSRRSPPSARAAFLAFATRFPDDALAPEAVFLATTLGDPTGTDTLLAMIVARWPRDLWASEARFHLATRVLSRNDTAGAVAFYRAELALAGPRASAARLALARLSEAVGDSADARAALLALARDDSLGYYGAAARAAARLPDPVLVPVSAHEPAPWVQAAMVQLDLLEAASLDEEAQTLVGYLVTRPDTPPADLLDLGEALIQRNRVAPGIALGWRAARALTLNNPRVLRVIYPWPGRELIAGEAEKFGLDQYLLAGLIRQESGFEAHVVSRAGATGMMQLMPGTAKLMAHRLGVPWSDPMVTVADANVHLGAAHLAGLLRGYEGDVIPALAAYNAGGRPVDRWMRAHGPLDPFLFVERIPYAETRGYVRAVLRNQALYRLLYPPIPPG
jgi:soluble lytic murein transglycosylase